MDVGPQLSLSKRLRYYLMPYVIFDEIAVHVPEPDGTLNSVSMSKGFTTEVVKLCVHMERSQRSAREQLLLFLVQKQLNSTSQKEDEPHERQGSKQSLQASAVFPTSLDDSENPHEGWHVW